VERALTDRRDANPETYLASARSRPLPVPAAVFAAWAAALLTAGTALAYPHRQHDPAPTPLRRRSASSPVRGRRRPTRSCRRRRR
jgi:hypothetical protein